MLEHSVLVCRCAENLNNLSVVYRQLGEQRLAELAAEKARVGQSGGSCPAEERQPLGRRHGRVGRSRGPGEVAGPMGRSAGEAGGRDGQAPRPAKRGRGAGPVHATLVRP